MDWSLWNAKPKTPNWVSGTLLGKSAWWDWTFVYLKFLQVSDQIWMSFVNIYHHIEWYEGTLWSTLISEASTDKIVFETSSSYWHVLCRNTHQSPQILTSTFQNLGGWSLRFLNLVDMLWTIGQFQPKQIAWKKLWRRMMLPITAPLSLWQDTMILSSKVPRHKTLIKKISSCLDVVSIWQKSGCGLASVQQSPVG